MVMTKYSDGEKNAQREADAPIEQTPASQRNNHVQAPAEQKCVGNQRDIFEKIIRRSQALVIELPGFGNFQKFAVAADAIARPA